MNFGIFSRPGGKGHHDDVIPVHFGKGASDEAKKDALHTFSHQQCIACEDARDEKSAKDFTSNNLGEQLL